MEKWNLIIDVERCENCNNCVLATKDEHIGNSFPGYSESASETNADLITISRKVRGSAPHIDSSYLVKMCNHCDEAPCMKNSGDAITKRKDGIVIINPEKAKGKKEIVKSCPYGAIVWNEERQLPQTWYFDAHLLDQGWDKPRCQQACGTGVFETVKTSDVAMSQRAMNENLKVLLPHLGTKPRVYYRNLYRYEKCFISGKVCHRDNDIEDCLSEISVSLCKDDEVVNEAITDIYGEFKFDNLEPNSGLYKVIIEESQYVTHSEIVDLKDSQVVEKIFLKKKINCSA